MNTYHEEKAQLELGKILEFLATHEPDTEEYNKALINLKVLTEVLNSERKSLSEKEDKFAKWPLPPELLVPAVTNLVGIVLILNYENAHALTSKAIQWIGRKF